jgi:hypothetical protein
VACVAAQGRTTDDALPRRAVEYTHWYDMTPARRDFGYAPR